MFNTCINIFLLVGGWGGGRAWCVELAILKESGQCFKPVSGKASAFSTCFRDYLLLCSVETVYRFWDPRVRVFLIIVFLVSFLLLFFAVLF